MSNALVNTYATVDRSGAHDNVLVRECRDCGEWDELVTARCGEPLFQRAAWEQAWDVYGLRVRRLAATRNGQCVGLLQLVRQRSRLTGDQLVSLPWFDCAGIVADDAEAAGALADASVKLAETVGADWVQLRQQTAVDVSPHVRTDKVLLRLPLEADPETLWNGFKPRVRNQVRKAEKSGLKVEQGSAELVGEFFDVYSTNMRDLGSPSHSRRFFDAVISAFDAETRVYVVRLEGRAVAAGWTMANGGSLEIPWASSLKEFNGLCANHLLYRRILEEACREGFERFHFGRSTPGSGQYRFKKQWGAVDVPLHWYFLSQDDHRAARAAEPPTERLGWGTKLWRRLPLAAARRLGPWMIAGIP